MKHQKVAEMEAAAAAQAAAEDAILQARTQLAPYPAGCEGVSS